ncbi:unnamed protein product [Ambrosiozyma monospora]|uniref:DNA replication regulator SLD2 n=1 Tax=Ambrosiozyma monospora TaxID=43982 RepID=A0A9W6YQT6_AMBMO|nr:unnamed protein product [Ambrosiozyma monospora]
MTEQEEVKTIRTYFIKLRTKIKAFEKQHALKNDGQKPDPAKIKSNFKVYSNYQKYWKLKQLLVDFDAKNKENGDQNNDSIQDDVNKLIKDWAKFCKKLKLKEQKKQEQIKLQKSDKDGNIFSGISTNHSGQRNESSSRKQVASTPPRKSGYKNHQQLQQLRDVKQDDEENEEEEEDEPEDEDDNVIIGPTPQLNGRVLGLFDIQLSPEKQQQIRNTMRTPSSTPRSKSKLSQNLSLLRQPLEDPSNGDVTDKSVFKTPTKRTVQRKLNFAEAVTETHDIIGQDYDEFRTPTKKKPFKMIEIEATPAYFRSNSVLSSQQITAVELDQAEEDELFRYVTNENDSEDDDSEKVVGSDEEDNEMMISFVQEQNQETGDAIVSPTKFIEPSPILGRVGGGSFGKSFFTMNQELNALKRTLKFTEDEDDEDGNESEKNVKTNNDKDDSNDVKQKSKVIDEELENLGSDFDSDDDDDNNKDGEKQDNENKETANSENDKTANPETDQTVDQEKGTTNEETANKASPKPVKPAKPPPQQYETLEELIRQEEKEQEESALHYENAGLSDSSSSSPSSPKTAAEKQQLERDNRDRNAKYRKKVKTMKRTTRRVKLRTAELSDTDELENVDIQQEIKKMEKDEAEERDKKLKRTLNELDSDFDSDSEDEEEDNEEDGDGKKDSSSRWNFEEMIEKEKQDKLKGKKHGKHPLSNNFVRMKIHHKGRGKRFRRR